MDTARAKSAVVAFRWGSVHMSKTVAAELRNSNPDPERVSGAYFSYVMLRAFAAEVALKTLHFQVSGTSAGRTHNLLNLFQGLDATTRNSLEQRYQRLRNQALHQSGPATIREVFDDHSDDFVDWRYFYEGPATISTGIQGLELAVEALVKEVDAIV